MQIVIATISPVHLDGDCQSWLYVWTYVCCRESCCFTCASLPIGLEAVADIAVTLVASRSVEAVMKTATIIAITFVDI